MAYERFLYDFVILEPPSTLSNEPSDAMWSFIPVLYQRAAEDSCVSTVIHAVAYVNFAHRCNAPQAEALGEECLGRGMTLLSKMIADKKQAATDEALCSVYLMGVYEVRSYIHCFELVPNTHRTSASSNEKAHTLPIPTERTRYCTCVQPNNITAIQFLQDYTR